MFRASNCSSSAGLLYKQLTVFHHAEIILKLYELSRLSWYSVITGIKVLDREVGALKCYIKFFKKIYYITSISEKAIAQCMYVCGFKTSGDAIRLPYSIAFGCSIHPFLGLFHSWLCISHLSRSFGDGHVFFLPSGFQLITNLVIALGPFSRHVHTIACCTVLKCCAYITRRYSI
jgi:hypothetical protein